MKLLSWVTPQQYHGSRMSRQRTPPSQRTLVSLLVVVAPCFMFKCIIISLLVFLLLVLEVCLNISDLLID